MFPVLAGSALEGLRYLSEEDKAYWENVIVSASELYEARALLVPGGDVACILARTEMELARMYAYWDHLEIGHIYFVAWIARQGPSGASSVIAMDHDDDWTRFPFSGEEPPGGNRSSGDRDRKIRELKNLATSTRRSLDPQPR